MIPPTAVVIVSFNTREILRDCLDSVLATGTSRIIVADNGSTDGTLEMLRHEFPSVTVHEDSSNPGYGAAANAAIAQCREEYVVLLNSDTVLQPDAIEHIARYLGAHPRVAILGPRLRNADGSLQRSVHQFPTPLRMLLDSSWLGLVVARVPLLRRGYRVMNFAHDRAERVDWVTGAAIGIRRSAFEEAGGFDESFFMYYEEVDLCYRLRQTAWATHFAPVTDVMHLGGASTRAACDRMRAQMAASRLRFLRRHHSASSVRLAQAALKCAVGIKIVLDPVKSLLALTGTRRTEAVSRAPQWRRLLFEPKSRPR